MRIKNTILIYIGFFTLLGICVTEIINLHNNHFGDFVYFYKAAQALVQGNNLYLPGETGNGYIYPPLLAFLMVPLTYLSMQFAALIWGAINIGLLILCVFLSYHLIEHNFNFKFTGLQKYAISAVAILFCYHEILWEFKGLQSDILVLAGILAGLALMHKYPIWAGICLGAVAGVKYQSLFFLPLLVMRGRYWGCCGMLIGLILAVVLPSVLIGWKLNWEYSLIAIKGLLNMPGPNSSSGVMALVPKITWHGNISITSGIYRLFLDHGISIHYAYILIFTLLTFVFTALYKLFHYYQIPFLFRSPTALHNPPLEQAVFTLECLILLMVMLIFSPQCIMRHLILLLGWHFLGAALLFSLPKLDQPRMVWLAVLLFPICKLFDDFGVRSLHLFWNYIGGPGWALLISLLLVSAIALNYIIKKLSPSIPLNYAETCNEEVFAPKVSIIK